MSEDDAELERQVDAEIAAMEGQQTDQWEALKADADVDQQWRDRNSSSSTPPAAPQLPAAAPSSSFLQLPIHSRLNDASNILIAGCGGGFDITGGLPLYFSLAQAGKRVHLANLTFSRLDSSDAEVLCTFDNGDTSRSTLVKVTADTGPDLLVADRRRS